MMKAPVAPPDSFLERGEVVARRGGADDELAVAGLLHPAVLPDDQRGHRLGALETGDVEAFDAPRRALEPERGLQAFGDGPRARLEHAETLREAVLGVFPHQLEQGA